MIVQCNGLVERLRTTRALQFCSRQEILMGQDLARFGYVNLPFSRYPGLSSVVQ